MTCKGSYTAEDEAVVSAREKVVATAGEYELTLGQLQVYYWMEFRNFMSQYGTYASYFGLDVSKPLDTQMCSGLEEARTWQQFFLEGALNSWNNYRARPPRPMPTALSLPSSSAPPSTKRRRAGGRRLPPRLRVRHCHAPFQPGRRCRAGGLRLLHGAVLQGKRLLRPDCPELRAHR